MGATFSSSVALDQGDNGFVRLRVIMADVMAGTSTALSTLKSFNAATHTLVATLGPVPSNIVRINLFGFGDNMLGTGENSLNYSDSHLDVFFANSDKANSLIRLTDTPMVDEDDYF